MRRYLNIAALVLHLVPPCLLLLIILLVRVALVVVVHQAEQQASQQNEHRDEREAVLGGARSRRWHVHRYAGPVALITCAVARDI